MEPLASDDRASVGHDRTSTYTGHVSPGGDPVSRHLEHVTITKLSVGPMDNNAYLLVCTSTGEAVLIDAANDAERLLALCASPADPIVVNRLAAIVTTHRHPDHWQALESVASRTGAAVMAGGADADELPVPVERRLDHGDTLSIGDVQLGVIGLRGHTPGSVAIRYDDPSGVTHLFTGDSLFPGGPGKTWSPEDFTSLMDDLESRVFTTMGDDTWVYPGHGDDTTLGAERPHLAEWRTRGW